MNATQADRLLKLAKYLRTVDAKQFNLNCYASAVEHKDVDDYNLDVHSEAVVKYLRTLPARFSYKELAATAQRGHECCTTACALGYATDLWPQKFSLSSCFDLSDYEDTDPVSIDIMINAGTDDSPTWRPGAYCSLLVQEFFGLSTIDCDYLFSADHSRTALEEAQVIEELVADCLDVR